MQSVSPKIAKPPLGVGWNNQTMKRHAGSSDKELPKIDADEYGRGSGSCP